MTRCARTGLVQPTQPFSLWRGSNDKLRSERDLRFYGIPDEALCFDAFHDSTGIFQVDTYGPTGQVNVVGNLTAAQLRALS